MSGNRPLTPGISTEAKINLKTKSAVAYLSVKSVKSFNALILPAITLENNNMKEADRGWSSLTGRFYLESH